MLAASAQHCCASHPFWMVVGVRTATEADLYERLNNLRETTPFVAEESMQRCRIWKCRRMEWRRGVRLSGRLGECFLWISSFREKYKNLWSVLERGRNKTGDTWIWIWFFFSLADSTELLPKFSYLETVELPYQMQESFFKETVAQDPAGIWKLFYWQMIMDFILSSSLCHLLQRGKNILLAYACTWESRLRKHLFQN